MQDECGCGCGGHETVHESKSEHMCGCGGHGHAQCRTADTVVQPVALQETACDGHQPGGHAGKCRPVFRARRIHALCGVMFGLFLALHLIVNASAWNIAFFRDAIAAIRALHRDLPWLIGLAIFLPLLAQFGTGLFLLFKAGLRYDTGSCNRGSTPRYFLQRFSAAILLVFILLHLGTLHGWSLSDVPRGASTQGLAGYDPVRILFGGHWFAALLFPAGVLAAAFHLANGAISGAQVWGVWRSRDSKQHWRFFCLIFGVFLVVAGVLAIGAFFRATL